MNRFLKPSYEDSARYKGLNFPEVWDKTISDKYADHEFVSSDEDKYALEHLLGRQLEPADFGSEGALATTDTLRKLAAYKARRALAEYLLRSRSFERPMNDHVYGTDANTLALLSFDPEDKLAGYADKYDVTRYKEVIQQLVNDVPEVLYSESNANDKKYALRDKALKDAAAAGVTYEDKYGDTVEDGVKNGRYINWNANALYDQLHPFSEEPLVTGEEKEALSDNSVLSALKDLKY